MRRLLLAATCLLALTPPVMAQTAPVLPSNSRLTSSELNQAFATLLKTAIAGVQAQSLNGSTLTNPILNGVISGNATVGGSSFALIAAQAAAAQVAGAAVPSTVGFFMDPTRSAGRVAATQCAGNNTATGVQAALGGVCVNIYSPSNGAQTYASQFTLDVPANTPNGGDQVGLFEGIHLNAFSANGWADNAQTTVEQDGPTAIIGEWDLTNKSGCDNTGAGGTTVTSAVAMRSDGSTCPNKFGLLLTGVPYSGTAEAGIAFQYAGNTGRFMWQDGITFVGGYVDRESDIFSDNLSFNPIWIRGVHSGSFLDLQDGQTAYSAILIGEHNVTSSRIEWTHGPSDTSPDLGSWGMGPQISATLGSSTGIGWQLNTPGGQAVAFDQLGNAFMPGRVTAGDVISRPAMLNNTGGLALGVPVSGQIAAINVNTDAAYTNYLLNLGVGGAQRFVVNNDGSLATSFLNTGSAYVSTPSAIAWGSGNIRLPVMLAGGAAEWNKEGLGEVDFHSFPGTGVGGYAWYQDVKGGLGTTPIMSLLNTGELDISGLVKAAGGAFSISPTVPNLTAGDSSNKVVNGATLQAALAAQASGTPAAFTTPASETTACTAGTSGDGVLSGVPYHFYCFATNQWSRVALSSATWP